jgi:hypothetical protein
MEDAALDFWSVYFSLRIWLTEKNSVRPGCNACDPYRFLTHAACVEIARLLRERICWRSRLPVDGSAPTRGSIEDELPSEPGKIKGNGAITIYIGPMLFLPPSDGHDASSLAVVWIEVILSTIMVPCRRLSRPRPGNCYDGWVVLVCNPDVGDAFHYLAVCDR